jgi:hypothetical protein
MVSPAWPPFSAERDENAVAFAKPGNAKLNKIGARVNDGEQMLKIRGSALTAALRCLTPCSARNALSLRFRGHHT